MAEPKVESKSNVTFTIYVYICPSTSKYFAEQDGGGEKDGKGDPKVITCKYHPAETLTTNDMVASQVVTFNGI